MIESSALRRLLQEENGVTDSFWLRVTEFESPFVEDCNNSEKRLVTFVFRARTALSNVVLLSSINRQDVQLNRLSQYKDTNLWFLSLELGADLRTRYLLSPDDSLIPFTDDDVLSQRSGRVCVDQFNSNTISLPSFEDDPEDTDVVYSVLELPHAPDNEHTQIKAAVPSGSIAKHYLESRILGNRKPIWYYTPSTGTAEELLIFFDGWSYLTAVQAPTILDNLIFDARLPPVVAAFIDHELWSERQSELTCNSDFSSFLVAEFLPWITQQFGPSYPPEKITLVGSSFGGLAACYAALEFPSTFPQVVAQSCSVMWQDDYLIQAFELEQGAGSKIYLDVGSQEFSHRTNSYSTESLRRFVNVLRSKNYDVVYIEFNGGHDYNCWSATLASGLTAFR